MALIKAKTILEGNKPHPVDIQLGHIEENGKKLPVVLTLNMSDKLLRVYQEADDLYRASPRLPIMTSKQAKRMERKRRKIEGRVVNDYIAYCVMILEEGYANIENFFDNPSKEVLIAYVKQEPGFAEKLAQALNYYFQGEDRLQIQFLEDTEKN